MNDWALLLFAILAAANLFLIPAAFREYRRSLAPVQDAQPDAAEAHRRIHRKRSLNLALVVLQVLFVLLMGLLLLGRLPLLGAWAVFALCAVVLVVEYRLSVLRDRLR